MAESRHRRCRICVTGACNSRLAVAALSATRHKTQRELLLRRRTPRPFPLELGQNYLGPLLAPDSRNDQTRGMPSLVTNPAVFITDLKVALACASITVWTQAGQSQKGSRSLAAIKTRSRACLIGGDVNVERDDEASALRLNFHRLMSRRHNALRSRPNEAPGARAQGEIDSTVWIHWKRNPCKRQATSRPRFYATRK